MSEAHVLSPPLPVSDVDVRIGDLLPRLPADAVVSGLTAARVHGLWVPDRPGPVEVSVPAGRTTPRGRPHTRRPVRHRRRQLGVEDVCVVDGVPVTGLARTWVDLAEILSTADLVAAGDSALRAGATSADLAGAVDDARRRRGVVRARLALPLLDARARSRPESRMRYELVTSGLPAPEVNVPVVVHGAWIGEPDLQYREARVAVEYQGDGHAEVSRMRRDITRKLDFAAVGWVVVEAGPAEVFRYPGRLVGRVRFEVSRRTPGLLVPARPR